MLRITGYSDQCSVEPGDEITFYVHSEFGEPYQSDIVRLINGDTNPEGPGFKEKVFRTSVNGKYKGENQPLMAGSYILGPQSGLFDLESMTMCAYIYPTTPVVDTEGVAVGEQALLGKWDDSKKMGYGLFINDAGALEFKIGKGRGKVETFSTKKWIFSIITFNFIKRYIRRTFCNGIL